MSEKSRDELDRDVAGTGKPDAAVDESNATAETVAETETPEDRAGDDAVSADASNQTIVRKTSKAPVRKGHATRKRNAAEGEQDDPYKAHNPAQFTRQSVGELKQVVWPTWPETVKMFSAVLVFVLIMIAVVGVLDVAFGWSLLKILGR